MLEDTVEIEAPDGLADAMIYSPETGVAGPGVIHLTDIRGIRDSQRQMAGRLVAEGFVVLVPNVFYRTGRSPVFDFPLVFGEERTMRRFEEITAPLTPEAMERDMAAYTDFLTAHRSVRNGPIGVVGYCATGKMALHAAAIRSSVVRAAASFHGGGLVTDAPSSPHLLLPRITASLYFGHAVEDRSMSADAIATLDRGLAAWGGVYQSEVYAGAHHGWTMPDHAAYNPAQADRAFQKLSALFRKTLRS